MSKATPITIVGATGLTGHAAFTSLLSSIHPFAVTALTRRPLDAPTSLSPGSTYTNKVYPDLFDAPKETVAEPGGIYVSCLGTTRAAAGGLEKQEKIDVFLNCELAEKAKKDGADYLLLVSSGGSSPTSHFPYSRMKGTVEENVKRLGFKHCVILRPGLLMGTRTEMRVPEWTFQKIFGGLKTIGAPVGSLCIDGTDVGKCIAYLAANPPDEPVTILNNSQIIATAALFKGNDQTTST
ncbi:putative endoplasmic reticulum protein [Naematelia encephala]|uniref:Putative endoplasmic reticulum protein n=1 Tax=Naematelia encephala TaxID=71784 RepID=A0A1Y2BLJ8_9TREE|nr:putative endoplasmic reticulum protein [Naematelia encephala]